MNVVGHEAIMVTAQGRGFCKKLEKDPAVGFIIGRFMEYHLAVVSPRKDVVGGLRGESSSGSRHLNDLWPVP